MVTGEGGTFQEVRNIKALLIKAGSESEPKAERLKG
jgi:hypothetical protein